MGGACSGWLDLLRSSYDPRLLGWILSWQLLCLRLPWLGSLCSLQCAQMKARCPPEILLCLFCFTLLALCPVSLLPHLSCLYEIPLVQRLSEWAHFRRSQCCGISSRACPRPLFSVPGFPPGVNLDSLRDFPCPYLTSFQILPVFLRFQIPHPIFKASRNIATWDWNM